jgi:hypothetical protein
VAVRAGVKPLEEKRPGRPRNSTASICPFVLDLPFDLLQSCALRHDLSNRGARPNALGCWLHQLDDQPELRCFSHAAALPTTGWITPPLAGSRHQRQAQPDHQLEPIKSINAVILPADSRRRDGVPSRRRWRRHRDRGFTLLLVQFAHTPPSDTCSTCTFNGIPIIPTLMRGSLAIIPALLALLAVFQVLQFVFTPPARVSGCRQV